MLGAIIGDITGSRYEFDNFRSKEIPFLEGFYTDDSVLTFADCEALLNSTDKEDFRKNLIKEYKRFAHLYPDVSYGPRFRWWASSKEAEPYGSMGNGAAMRVSPTAYFGNTLEDVLELAKISSEVTHDHPEAIKAAQAVAGSIFLAKNGASKEEILDFVKNYYGQDFLGEFRIDSLRDSYSFDVTCPGSVPHAIEAFLEGDSFEDVIKTAVSLGGDSDTIAAIAGSIAEPFYGITPEVKKKALDHLDGRMRAIYERFENDERNIRL